MYVKKANIFGIKQSVPDAEVLGCPLRGVPLYLSYATKILEGSLVRM